MEQHQVIYFDALSIASTHQSGIAHTLHRTLKSLLQLELNQKIVLVVPLGKAKFLPAELTNNERVTVKTIPLPNKVFELLLRLRLVPPVDLWLGKGVYVFPNFKNWPLWKSRSITYIHDLAFLRFPEFIEEKNLKYLNKYIKRWVNRTDALVTVSEHAKQEIHDLLHIPESTISVVYNGVEADLFKPKPKKHVLAKKKEYGLPDKEYLLAVGNFEPRKNLERLVRVYSNLPKKLREEYPLVLIGGGGWKNEGIMEAIDSTNQSFNQIYKPSKYVEDSDLSALICGARALVHPAIYEGFGIPPLEAMACGVPVASSNASSLPEVVGEAATTFDPQSEAEMLAALKRVLTDEKIRKQLVTAGNQRVELFTWHQSATKLSAVITQQMSRGLKTETMVHVLRGMYKKTDESIRKLLGEKDFPPYAFPRAENQNELQTQLYTDFLAEQPKRLQSALFTLYITARKTAGTAARGLKSGIKRVKNGV